MKAIVCTKYGAPDVLQLQEVEKPIPKANEVRIKIFYTAVTASDCIVRGFKLPRWHPMGILMGIVLGFTKPRKPILGMVLAGEVESMGQDVRRFQQGDAVFGSTLNASNQIGVRFGAYAEYTCLPEKQFDRTPNQKISVMKMPLHSPMGMVWLSILSNRATFNRSKKCLSTAHLEQLARWRYNLSKR